MSRPSHSAALLKYTLGTLEFSVFEGVVDEMLFNETNVVDTKGGKGINIVDTTGKMELILLISQGKWN